METNPTKYNNRLRAARGSLNLTQEEMARSIGTTALTINRWEQGKSSPQPYYRQKLCELFNLSPAELGLTLEEQNDDETNHTFEGINESTSYKFNPSTSDPEFSLTQHSTLAKSQRANTLKYRITERLETLFVPILVGTGLLISIADLLGLFHWTSSSSVSILILLIVSLILSALFVIQKRTTEIYERTQLLLSKISIDRMAKEAIEQIDPGLRKVLKDDYFLDVVGFLSTAIHEGKVPVNDSARFRFYYIRTLKSFQRATFLSTNLATEPTLWEDHAIEQATTEFVSKGGTMKQIFFVKNAQEHSLPTTQAKITRMQKMGVQVHVVDSSVIPGDLKKDFIVESKGRIAWEIYINHNGHIGSGVVTTNKNITTSYVRIFEKLFSVQDT